MMRKLASILEGISILGTALLGSTLSGSAQSLPNRALSTLDRVYPNESYAQYYYHRHYYHDDSAAVAAGVAGLAAGALIGTAIATKLRRLLLPLPAQSILPWPLTALASTAPMIQ